VPKQFLKLVERTGFGRYLFNDWRVNPDGTPKQDFVLNRPRYKDGRILLARDNFGCGSSREHAVWALADYGFRTLIAPSYADIFYSNCFKNGVLPITLNDSAVSELFSEVEKQEGYSLDVDLEKQIVCKPDGTSLSFQIDGFRKKCLLDGSDEISLTLLHEQSIRAYEQQLAPFQLVSAGV
jgi:3-isopropylmalate/(R)-2-methylmalate dehydratase small subunit